MSFCNGINFFNTAFQLMREGPAVRSFGRALGEDRAHRRAGWGLVTTCPVTRNFDMVDQDPSDNVTTDYLLNPATGQTAQDTAANAANLTGATEAGSTGVTTPCSTRSWTRRSGALPCMAPDLGNNNAPATSQALDELLAARNQPRIAAWCPENDEMVLDANGNLDPAKTNLYREEIGQAPINAPEQQDQTAR